MPKLPRNITGKYLSKFLKKYGYIVTRQTGSHIRLTNSFPDHTHNLTIPDHRPIKVGTLNRILADIANNLNISKADLIAGL
jgi:predicted RNA binding protein YcfA (HicA-like mRNA interferase family)